MSAARTLKQLLGGIAGAEIRGLRADQGDLEICEVRDDSRRVGAGDLFVAVPGAAADGRTFVADALARGAVAVVMERGAAEVAIPGPVVIVPNAREAVAVLAANRYRAAPELTLTAVTGTNGKTTTTYLVEAMLQAAGALPGVIGTVAYRFSRWPGGARVAPLTTPGALALHALFREMKDAGATDVVLEASSHALDQRRLEGCRFRVAALTNVTQDHLDYHGTMEQYFQAKAVLFERLIEPGRGVAVLPVDLDEGRRMRARTGGPVLGVAVEPGHAGADVVVTRRELTAEGLRAELQTPLGRLDVRSRLVGDFNLANLTLAVGIAVARGLSAEAIVSGLARLSGVPGRLERVENDRGVLCVVDYAHTPDALERAIAALRPLTAGRLFVVFGCGGDRDRGKRPLMGRAAVRDADLAIVTSDNPRTEEPASIVEMILDGVRAEGTSELTESELAAARRGYHVELDRRAAIRRVVGAARAGDVLLIAGKGHEDYQIIGRTKIHFDDREEAAAAFAEAGARVAGGAS